MPDLQPPNLLPPMAGLALLSQIAERRQQANLAYERMVQESALRQQTMAQEAQLRREGFQVQRERLAQELPLQKAQIDNLRSDISHRLYNEKRFADQDAETTRERTELANRIESIPQDGPAIGTNDYHDQFNEIKADYTDILGDPQTRAMLRDYQQRYVAARKAGQGAVDDILRGKGYEDYGVLANPQQGPDYSKGVPTPDKIGTHYSFLIPNPKAKTKEDMFIQSQPWEKGSYEKTKNMYNQYFGTGDAPIAQQNQANAQAASIAAQQQAAAAPKVLTSDIARAYLNKAGGDKDKARAAAQADGFTF